MNSSWHLPATAFVILGRLRIYVVNTSGSHVVRNRDVSSERVNHWRLNHSANVFVVFFKLFFQQSWKWKKALLETSHSSSVWRHFPLSHDSLVRRAIQMNHPEIQQRFPWISTPLLRQTNTLVCIRVMWSFLINRCGTWRRGPEGERQVGQKNGGVEFQRFHRIDSIFTMELCDLERYWWTN